MYIDLDTIETAVVLSSLGALCCTHLQLNGRICLCILRDTVGIFVLSLVIGQVSECSLVSACGCHASGVVPLVVSSLTLAFHRASLYSSDQATEQLWVH